ncbi:protein TolR [Radicibacter daui]|uniref:protein TolR n=1 Tax=Radicibacter daui TaxID=3064829 RepID=UPI004046AE3B
MGAALAGGGGGGRKRGRRRTRAAAMSDINVTPLVDVMLVLLIVFMVAAPLLTVGVPVDLPRSNAPAIAEQTEPLVVSVNAQGEIFVQEQKVEIANLVPLLQAIIGEKPDQRIFVRGDANLNYGRIMQVMGEVTRAGYKRVALVALPEQK